MRSMPARMNLREAARTRRDRLRRRTGPRRQARSSDGPHRRPAPGAGTPLFHLRLPSLAGRAGALETGSAGGCGALRAVSRRPGTGQRISRIGAGESSARASCRTCARAARAVSRSRRWMRICWRRWRQVCRTAPGSPWGSIVWSRSRWVRRACAMPWHSTSTMPERVPSQAPSLCRATDTRRCGYRCAEFRPR